MTRQELDVQVKNGGLTRIWHGVYAAGQPDLLGRIQALDLFMGRHAVVCMGRLRPCMASIPKTQQLSISSTPGYGRARRRH